MRPDDLAGLHLENMPTFQTAFDEAAETFGFVAAVEYRFDPEMVFLGGRWPDRHLAGLLVRLDKLLSQSEAAFRRAGVVS